MAQIRSFLLLLSLCVVAACSSITPDDPAATLQTQREGYVAEATSIAQAAQAQGTQIVETVAAAETYTALIEGRNEQLMATMQIAFPPTQALVVNNGAATPGQNPTPAPVGVFPEATPAAGEAPLATAASLGGAQFTQVETASGVRDTDGCADTLTRSFPAGTATVYITARALNVSAGTTMSVEWFYEGEPAHSESFTIPSDDDDFCLWFSLVANETALSSGNWAVKLYANSQSVEPAQIDFTIGM